MRVSAQQGAPRRRAGDRMWMETAIGMITAILVAGGIGGWAAYTELAGAVIAPGTVVVESHVKKVQHPTGGVVGEIRVRDGDRVREGDLVMRLDETVMRASLQIVVRQIDQFIAQRARLVSERDGDIELSLSDEFKARLGEPEFEKIAQAEAALLETRKSAREGQKAQLKERILQLHKEIIGIDAQLAAKIGETGHIRTELDGLEELWAQKLTPLSKITALRREATRLAGEHGQLEAARAQAGGKIAETEIQVLQIDENNRAEVMKELREVQAKLAELGERRVVAEDQLKRIDIRAPMSGSVHQMSVHTVGGVVSPSDPVMLIVPESDNLVIEVKISPQDIDQVRTGQSARVRFSAFNQRTTPELTGSVSRVAADLTREAQSNQQYYVARVALDEAEIQRLDGLKLLPGMPAEVHVRTADRTALSFLLKPLTDQLARAFKER